MSENIHKEYLSRGYRAERVIPDSRIDEGLSKLALEIAKGYFLDTRICSADIALAGERMIPAEPSHIVYAKISPKHPSEAESGRTKKHSVHLCCIDTVDERTVRL